MNDKTAFFRVHPSYLPWLPQYIPIMYNNEVLYVKKHVNDGFFAETSINGNEGDYGYKVIKVSYETDGILKQYDPKNIIEMKLIQNSLADKDERIRLLEERIKVLEQLLKK